MSVICNILYYTLYTEIRNTARRLFKQISFLHVDDEATKNDYFIQ